MTRRTDGATRATSLTRLAGVVLVALVGGAVAACGDPVHDDAVDALGPEAPGVRPSQTHRPGQPCLVCHGADGPAHPELSIAGTLYASPTTKTPVSGATVRVLDAAGTWYETTTNCAGNFMVLAADYVPRPPLYAAVKLGNAANVMQSPMHRDGSCNSCHADPPSESAEGHIYLEKSPASVPPGGCP